ILFSIFGKYVIISIINNILSFLPYSPTNFKIIYFMPIFIISNNPFYYLRVKPKIIKAYMIVIFIIFGKFNKTQDRIFPFIYTKLKPLIFIWIIYFNEKILNKSFNIVNNNFHTSVLYLSLFQDL